MKKNVKNPRLNQTPGIISKCLQQMINVTTSINPRKSQTPKSSLQNKAFSRIKTLPEIEEIENPRNFVPEPQNFETSLVKKPQFTKDFSLGKNLESPFVKKPIFFKDFSSGKKLGNQNVEISFEKNAKELNLTKDFSLGKNFEIYMKKPNFTKEFPLKKKLERQKYEISFVKKANFTKDVNLGEEFEKLRENVWKVRNEERKIQNTSLKGKKEWEHSLILQDFKLRLYEKAFFLYLQSRILLKKQKKCCIEFFLAKISLKKKRLFFENLKENSMKKRKKIELLESVQVFRSLMIQRIYMKKMLVFLWGKKRLNGIQKKITENSIFFSLKNFIKRLDFNRFYAKNYRKFVKNKVFRIKTKCFTALKPEKLSISSIKQRIFSLNFNEEKIAISKPRVFFKKILSKEMKNLKNREKELRKRAFTKEKIVFSKGKFNIEEIKRTLICEKQKQLKKKAWFSLKIATYEGKKELFALKFHKFKQKNQLFQQIKLLFQLNSKISSEKSHFAQVFYDISQKKMLIRVLKNKVSLRRNRIKAYLLAKSFNLLKKYSKFCKNKRNCLNSISEAYSQKFKANLLHKWQKIARNSQPLNALFKTNLKKRYFEKISEKFRQRKLLKKYLILLSLQEKPSDEKSSQFQFLKA